MSALLPLIQNIYTVILRPLILLLWGIAFVVFLWGVIQFIQSADKDDKRKEAKDSIVYGIIGMVIMLSSLGIINILLATLGVSNPVPSGNAQPVVPDVSEPF